ncbi:large subunit ribosomal protein L29 [Lishizhenia tianjinensis]|uniref:Large ribosomal subunit protein uL29 n=1 Tax=Lishizhenia tianjinensis TaxID=477690 RepID=A0A1I7A6M4_9FLAO|nr:50S ribosomal protein L29 [Lishizhenia tianjinensis]SFT70562.1 large subunit ribosomal protein L29 [Lishizhenia tianjinensis]
MKQEEINQLSVEDLKNRIEESMEKMAKLKLTHAVSPLENPLQIKDLRRSIARLNTEMTKRQKQA